VSQNDPADEAAATPEAQPSKKATARNIGAVLAGLGLLVAKFAFIFGKLVALSWTFILSLWLYVVFFGWRFAVVLMFVLLAHELGHYAAFRAYGLPARLPQFIPFLGAYTSGAMPAELEDGAHIALAGPLTGLGLAGACYVIGALLHDPFWLAIANVSAFLNLFNLIPLVPFDGGRVAAAIFPRAAPIAIGARLRVAAWYFGTAIGLILMLSMTHVDTHAGRSIW
jgi:Zn-dependent protease